MDLTLLSRIFIGKRCIALLLDFLLIKFLCYIATIGLISLLPLRFIVPQQNPERPLTVGNWIVYQEIAYLIKTGPQRKMQYEKKYIKI